jgi:hypothetical protein
MKTKLGTMTRVGTGNHVEVIRGEEWEKYAAYDFWRSIIYRYFQQLYEQCGDDIYTYIYEDGFFFIKRSEDDEKTLHSGRIRLVRDNIDDTFVWGDIIPHDNKPLELFKIKGQDIISETLKGDYEYFL